MRSLREEVRLVGRLLVAIAGRDHHAFDAEFHDVVHEAAHALGIDTVEQRRVRGDAETSFKQQLYGVNRDVVRTFVRDGEVVVLAFSIEMDGKGQVLARLEEMQLFAQQQGVRAEINVLPARDQSFDNFPDLRMQSTVRRRGCSRWGARILRRP